MEMPLHLSLAADEHHPAGNRFSPGVLCSDFTIKDLGQQ
jgi:hypothetical protein